MQHLAVVRVVVRAVRLLHPGDGPGHVDGEREEDRPEREEGPVLEQSLDGRARLLHRVDVVERALDVPEQREDRDEQHRKADGAQRFHRGLAGERGQRAGNGGAGTDAELRIDVALHPVVDLRLAREEVDDAVEHGEERHQGKQGQIGERRRAQRDDLAPEPAADAHRMQNRSDTPHRRERVRPFTKRQETGCEGAGQSPTFTAGGSCERASAAAG